MTEQATVAGVQSQSSLGRVVQIIGTVVDCEFPEEHLPEIYDAIVIEGDRGEVTCEVQTQLGNSVIRAVALTSTDGLRRGMGVRSTGGPITVPVGPPTLGRVFDVLGHPIDERGPVEAETFYPIHRPAPAFVRAVLARSGWRWRERLALLLAAGNWARSGFVCDPGLTVAQLAARLPPRIRADLIDPLCVAALNTPVTVASATGSSARNAARMTS